MADFKAIMTLAVAGRSYDEIVAVVGCSRRDVAAAKKTIAAYGFTAGQIGAMSPQEIARLFPDGRKRVTELYERPDFDRVLASMRENRHFTLQQAWSRYLASAIANGGKKYGYSQYCALFADHARVSDVVATLHHEPGRAMLVDWAGDTLEVVDAANDLFAVLANREHRLPTLIDSQSGPAYWVEALPDRVAADSIVNRLANNARQLNLGDVDMRQLRDDRARAQPDHWE